MTMWTPEAIRALGPTTDLPTLSSIFLIAPLPPIRFHDLRHGAASMLRAAKVEIKVISEILGHASTSFTDDVYTVVAEELAEQAARAVSASVPRRQRQTGS